MTAPADSSTGVSGARAVCRAVHRIMVEQEVGEISAYTILVRASVDSHTSLGETAARLLLRAQADAMTTAIVTPAKRPAA